ncbi:hypothetical protein L1887_48158 [Cichorium endivia]|nr:hypothetical protein L1887_48158 [Cichorium endivia]
MAQYQRIYTYRTNRAAAARHNATLGLVALLALVAVASVVFLSITDYVYWRQTRPNSFLNQLAPQPIRNGSLTDQGKGGTMGSVAGSTLDDFLVQAKRDAFERLKAGAAATQKLTLVMGNEAGDLDSAACAIGLSYLLSRFGPPQGYTLGASSYVPLIQSMHSDDVLRPENTAAFRAAGIDPEHTLCLDDIQHTLGLALDSDAFAPAANVALGLVDHPSLTGPWGGSGASNRDVEIVLDHHEDVGDHAGAPLRIVKSPSKEPVGSCSSMVADLFAANFVQADSTDVAMRQVADLLMSAIVIDTDNLRAAPRGKATQTDFDAVKTLFPASSFGNPETSQRIRETALAFSPLKDQVHGVSVEPIQPVSPSEHTDSATQSAKIILAPFWSILSRAKQAVDHLAGRDLLRRDYKELDFVSGADESPLSLKLGFASVPISMVEWLHKDRPTPQLADAAEPKQEIDVAVMTGSFRVPEGEVDAGKHKRELVLAFAPRSLRESQASVLWQELRRGLETDAHVPADQVDRRLMLEEPWKGQRLPESAGGKKERVHGVDTDGRRLELVAHAQPRWAKVYRQANARANRKIVLPAVTTVLKAAARKLCSAVRVERKPDAAGWDRRFFWQCSAERYESGQCSPSQACALARSNRHRVGTSGSPRFGERSAWGKDEAYVAAKLGIRQGWSDKGSLKGRPDWWIATECRATFMRCTLTYIASQAAAWRVERARTPGTPQCRSPHVRDGDQAYSTAISNHSWREGGRLHVRQLHKLGNSAWHRIVPACLHHLRQPPYYQQ